LSQTLLQDARLFELFRWADVELAEETRMGGCACNGSLHVANYWRKPRGGPACLAPDYALRLSFCCGRDKCRRRRTPPSLRFLGRKVYLAAIVVLATALQHGVTPVRASKLRELVGVSRRTLKRWRQWWQGAFVKTRFWLEARGRLMPPVEEGDLPSSLLARFAASAGSHARVLAVLRFLSPLSTATATVPLRAR
jgi:hypothetical protein